MVWNPGADLLGVLVVIIVAVIVYMRLRKIGLGEMIAEIKATWQEMNKP